MNHVIEPREEQQTATKIEPAAVAPSDNRRHFRVRTSIRAGAGMVCPTGEC